MAETEWRISETESNVKLYNKIRHTTGLSARTQPKKELQCQRRPTDRSGSSQNQIIFNYTMESEFDYIALILYAQLSQSDF